MMKMKMKIDEQNKRNKRSEKRRFEETERMTQGSLELGFCHLSFTKSILLVLIIDE